MKHPRPCSVCGRPFAPRSPRQLACVSCRRILQWICDIKAEIRRVHGPEAHAVVHVEVLDVPLSEHAGDAPRLGPVIDAQVGMTLEWMKYRAIIATLAQCGGIRADTARLLGISKRFLNARLGIYRNQGLLPAELDRSPLDTRREPQDAAQAALGTG